jgi:hypothetical protein
MNVRSILLLLVSLIVTGNSAFAQTELAPYEIVPDGKQYEIQLGPDQINLKWFYALTGVFILASAISLLFSFSYVFLVPLALLVLYFLIFQPDKIYYFLNGEKKLINHSKNITCLVHF